MDRAEILVEGALRSLFNCVLFPYYNIGSYVKLYVSFYTV